MTTTNINIRIDKNIKEQAEKLFDELGLDITTAINIFLKASIREHGIPFDLNLDIPNDTTISSIKEGKRLVNDPNAPKYSDIADLREALEK